MSVPMEIITDESLAEKGFYWREKDGVKVLVCRPLETAGFTKGFSTRLGGVSPFPENALSLAGFDDDSAENIYENRRRFLHVFEGEWRLASCWQGPSAGVRTLASGETPEEVKNDTEKNDVVSAQRPGVVGAEKPADSVPILIGAPASRSFAAVHAGWRGTA